MELKIKSDKISWLPIWGIYENVERIDFYYRKTPEHKGLTKQQVIEILESKGHKII